MIVKYALFDDINALTNSINYKPVIAGNQSNVVQDSPDTRFKPSREEDKKDDEDPNKYSEVPSTEEPRDNAVDENIVYGCADDLNMPNLEDIVYTDNDEDVGAEAEMTNLNNFIPVSPILTIRVHKDHLVEQIIRDLNSSPQTRRMTKNLNKHELPNRKRAIGTKWVFRNKKDERGIVIKNKARLVAQGYTQEEGIDYDEFFAPVARTEAIRLLLAYALFKDFVVYHMDVKSAFLYCKIEEKVHVCQPPRFEDPDFPDRLYKVEKALYGLHQAPRAWFASEAEERWDFISQDKYVTEILKKFGFSDLKTASTPMETHRPLLKDADDKPTESDGFEQIADFLNAQPIKYALMFNLTIYTSCIEQSWTNAKVKNVNGEVQIQALVDKKKVIITETSVRSDLQLEDDEGVKCLPNATIFEQLTLMWVTPLFPTMMVQAHEEVGEGSENPTDPHRTPTIIQPSTSQPKKKHPRKSKKKNIEVPQPSDSTDAIADENVPTHSNDLLLSGEDRLKLNELMKLCTNLSQRVLELEKTKTSQAAEITKLKERVKKLKKKGGSRTHRLRRLYKVGISVGVVSSDETSLGDQEDTSKPGRKIKEINQDAKVTLVDETQGRYGDNLMFDTGVLDNEEVFVEQDMTEKEVDMAEKDASTTDLVTTTSEVVTTANVEIKSAKPRAKGIAFKEPVESKTTTTTPISLPKPLQDKGKAKMIEPEKPLKKKDQIMFDQKLNADYELAERLQAEEQGELTIEEKSRLFVELLKNKSFDEVQKAFDKTMSWIDSFVPMDSEVVKHMVKGNENVEAKVDDDQEEAEMKKHMEIVSDYEVAIYAIPLATKPLIIVDWKIIKEGKIGYFQIIRADGCSKRYSSMIQMLQNIDREDLETLWKLVKAKHGLTRPEEAYERVLRISRSIEVGSTSILIVYVAAHYMCGEVRSSLQEETNVHELYVLDFQTLTGV
nr:copia protein [Tanacetum cinerariifolium]